MYYILVNPDSKHCSFSKTKHDICFGHQVPEIIPNYTNAQYIAQYGHEIIDVPCNTETDNNKMPKYDGIEKITIEAYLNRNVFRHNKINCQ